VTCRWRTLRRIAVSEERNRIYATSHVLGILRISPKKHLQQIVANHVSVDVADVQPRVVITSILKSREGSKIS
jgi:hypothetical protein